MLKCEIAVSDFVNTEMVVSYISYDEAAVAAVPEDAFPNQMSYLGTIRIRLKFVGEYPDTYETSARMPSDSVR